VGADDNKITIGKFNWPHVQHIGPVELTSEFSVLTMLPLNFISITGPCTFTAAPSNNNTGYHTFSPPTAINDILAAATAIDVDVVRLLFFHLVAMERLGWAVKWNKKLYDDEPDVMLEHPSVMSDSGLPEDERAVNGLAERVVEDMRAAGVTRPELIIVDTVHPHTREPLLLYTSRRRLFVLGHADGSPDHYDMPNLRAKLPPLRVILDGQPADGSPTLQV
jgi:hypothetical protein